MFISAWSRSVLAKTATLSGNAMIRFVSLWPMGHSTTVINCGGGEKGPGSHCSVTSRNGASTADCIKFNGRQ